MRPAPAMHEPAAIGVPDLAERWRFRVLAWRAAHPGLSRSIDVARLVLALVAVVALGVAAVLDEPFRVGLAQGLLLLAPVAVVLLLTRTRGITARFALCWLTVAAVFAPVIVLIASAVTALSGLTPTDDGAIVSVAAFVEETCKLLPFAAWSLVATNRVRSLTLTDYLVLGWLTGAGFAIVEESLRLMAIRTSGGLAQLQVLFGAADPRLTLNPLHVSYGDDVSPIHPVWSALVLGVLGIGIAIARRWSQLRALAWALPLVMLLVTIMDHGLGNSGADAWELLTQGADPVGKVLAVPWLLIAQGWLLGVAAGALWLLTAVLDAHRRAVAGQVEPSTLERMRRLSQGGALRRVLAAVVGLGLQTVDDIRRWGRDIVHAVSVGGRLGLALLVVAHCRNAEIRGRAASLGPLDRTQMRRLRLRIALWTGAGFVAALALARCSLRRSAVCSRGRGPICGCWAWSKASRIGGTGSTLSCRAC